MNNSLYRSDKVASASGLSGLDFGCCQLTTPNHSPLADGNWSGQPDQGLLFITVCGGVLCMRKCGLIACAPHGKNSSLLDLKTSFRKDSNHVPMR